MRKRNLTLTISNENHMKARLWAAQNDVSLSAIISALIESLPNNPKARQLARGPAQPPVRNRNLAHFTREPRYLTTMLSTRHRQHHRTHEPNCIKNHRNLQRSPHRCGAFTVIYVSRARKQKSHCETVKTSVSAC